MILKQDNRAIPYFYSKLHVMPEGKPWTGLYTCNQEAHGSYYFCGSGSMQCAFKNKGKELKKCSTVDCPNMTKPYILGKSYDIRTKMMYYSEIFV